MSVLKEVLGNNKYQRSAVMVVGTGINSILGLIFYILLGRSLPISSFGSLSFVLGMGVLASEVFDMGIGSSIIKFGQENLPKIIGLSFVQRAAVSIFLIVVAIALSPILGTNLFFSALVASSLLFFNIVSQALLSQEEAMGYVASNIAGNALRLLTIAILIFAGKNLNEVHGLFAFILGNIFSFLVGAWLIRKALNKNIVTQLVKTFQEVKTFASWAGVNFAVAALCARLDAPIIFYLAGAVQTGIYSSASRLTSIFPQLIAAIESVFAPELSKNSGKTLSIKDYFTVIVLSAAALIIAIPISPLLLQILFGEKYLPATGILQVLLLATVFNFLTSPLASLVFYHQGKTKTTFLITLVQLGTTIFLYFAFLPRFGAIGAAYSIAIGSALSLLFYVSLYFRNRHQYV